MTKTLGYFRWYNSFSDSTKTLSLCSHLDEEEKEAVEVTNAFKNMNVGHETKDGTINYNKTWE
mgnify:CR=1 FL=1